FFLGSGTRGLPVEEFKREILVGKAGAADLLTELSCCELLRSCIGDEVEARTVLAETQLQDLVGISKRIANQRPVLREMKWDNDLVFAKLTLKIDLLSRLSHSNRSQNLLCGRRRLTENRHRRERQPNDEARMTNDEGMTKSE